jgi:hypothetical protein
MLTEASPVILDAPGPFECTGNCREWPHSGTDPRGLAELYHQLLPSNWHDKFLSIWCGVQRKEQMEEALAAQKVQNSFHSGLVHLSLRAVRKNWDILNVGRILVRVSRGGRAEAVSTVIDSYREAMKDLAEVRKHADELDLYDNTAHGRGYRVVAHFTGGELGKAAQTIPDWVAKLFGKELFPAKQRARTGLSR